MIKCDEAMRRSKERCYIQEGVRWRCTHNCDGCHCALHKRSDGTWEHKVLDRHKGTYIPRGEEDDQQ